MAVKRSAWEEQLLLGTVGLLVQRKHRWGEGHHWLAYRLNSCLPLFGHFVELNQLILN